MKVPGAGFIIFKKINNEIKFLGLKGPDFIRKSRNGIWDFPKGAKENIESDWDAAVRECYEECSVKVNPQELVAGPFKLSSCVIYLAKTTQEPCIQKNPVYDIYEHEGWEWLKPEELERDCYDWLTPAVTWARSVLKV